MSELANLLQYTKGKKEYQVRILKRPHFEVPMKELHNYLDGKVSAIDIPIGYYLENYSSWFLINYLIEYIQTGQADHYSLARATMLGFKGNQVNYQLGQCISGYDYGILMRISVMSLSQALFLGWDTLAINYGSMLLDMLYGKFYQGGATTPSHPWFIMELFCRWQNIKLDKSKLNYPAGLGVYEEALEHLQSTNSELINNLVRKMAEFHINNSDEYDVVDEDGNEESAEFTSSNYFLFPLEILMFLSVRKRLGFTDTIVNNELMSLPINQFPSSKIAYPKDELVDAVFHKLIKDNPQYKELPKFMAVIDKGI